MTVKRPDKGRDRHLIVAPDKGVRQALSVHVARDGFVTSLRGRARRFGDSRNCQAAATAVRHVSIATARSARCVRAEVR